MNLLITLRTAGTSMRRHKVRSLLTMLGIIIGTMAIIVVMSLSAGAQYQVTKQIQSIGSNFIIVLAGAPKSRTIAQTRAATPYTTLTEEDLQAIVEEADDISIASAGIRTSVPTVHEGNNWRTLIVGVESSYFDILSWKLESGSYFTDSDVRRGAKVAIIGQTIKKELFGDLDPIGKTIRVVKIPFTVIGVLSPRGQLPMGGDQDDQILAPITTVQRKIMGVKNYGAIILAAKSNKHVDRAVNQIRSILRYHHKLADDEDDDFTIISQDDIAKASEAASAVLNLLLLLISSIALLVGGIGIMNIMLVTVKERTREIGIRMALGATPGAILRQFLYEAIIICSIGGLLGFGLGTVVAQIISMALRWPIYISPLAVGISIFSSIFVGIFFGYYPAKQASCLNPIDALADRGE